MFAHYEKVAFIRDFEITASFNPFLLTVHTSTVSFYITRSPLL